MGRKKILTDERKREILEAVETGSSVAAIARKVGLQPNTVHKAGLADREFGQNLRAAQDTRRGVAVDAAKAQLEQKATKGEMAAVKMLLEREQPSATNLTDQLGKISQYLQSNERQANGKSD